MKPAPTIPEILLDEDLPAELLRDYFNLRNPQTLPYFSGAKFETLGHRWDQASTTNKITPEDLLAVSCLAVNIPGRAAINILEEQKKDITKLLEQIPDTSLTLWDARESDIDTSSAMNNLWNLLNSNHNMGPTTISKLMARKRPNLIPIFDSVVSSALDLKKSTNHWTTMRDLMVTSVEGELLHIRLQRLVDKIELDYVTPLRAFDVIVWYFKNPRLNKRRHEEGLTLASERPIG
ncbi:hypothetical protein SAMN06298212_10848 [Ruaniaceae bacterium KH17]|nr:hypothetical protein SAMN06298212_10848 [Ruaniaceae bacterium KH17]